MESNGSMNSIKPPKKMKKFVAPLFWKMLLVFFFLSVLGTLRRLLPPQQSEITNILPSLLIAAIAAFVCFYMWKRPQNRAKEIYNTALFSLLHEDSERAVMLLEEAVLLYGSNGKINQLLAEVKEESKDEI